MDLNAVKNFFSLKEIDPKQMLSSMVASLARRKLEKFYDRAAQTDWVARIKQLDPTALRLFEQGAYAITAFVDQKLAPNSFIGQTLAGIGTDTAPEMMRRIMNGVREEIKHQASSADELGTAAVLLELDDAALAAFLSAMIALPPAERQQILEHLRRFTPDQQLRLAQLSIDSLRQHAELFTTPPEPAPPPEWPDRSANALREKIHQRRLAAQAQQKNKSFWRRLLWLE